MPVPPKVLTHAIKDVMIVNVVDTHIRDVSQVEDLGRHLYALVDEQDHRKLILDFSKVQSLSSQALGVLILLQKKIAAKKGKLVLCSVRPDIARLFEIARLNRILPQTADEATALAQFGVTATG